MLSPCTLPYLVSIILERAVGLFVAVVVVVEEDDEDPPKLSFSSKLEFPE